MIGLQDHLLKYVSIVNIRPNVANIYKEDVMINSKRRGQQEKGNLPITAKKKDLM